MVKEVEVKVFEERLYCDKCGAEMKHGGLVLCSYPPQYPYICPSCDGTQHQPHNIQILFISQ